jgi:hypothetical protein
VVVKMPDEFTDQTVLDLSESGRPRTRRGEKTKELIEIFSIVQNGVRRGISHRAEIIKVLGDRMFHFPKQLRGKGPLTV